MKVWITMQSKPILIGVGSLEECGKGIIQLEYKGKKYVGHTGVTIYFISLYYLMK